jgi:hypothetical protein
MTQSWHDLTLKLGFGTPNAADIIDALVKKELPDKAIRKEIDKNGMKVPINYKYRKNFNSNFWIEEKSTCTISHSDDDGRYHIYIKEGKLEHLEHAKDPMFLEKNITAITNALRRYPAAIIELEKLNEQRRLSDESRLKEKKESASRIWKRIKSDGGDAPRFKLRDIRIK